MWGRRRPEEPSQAQSEELAASFLLEELRIIDEEFRRLRAEGSARVASFLTTTAAAVGIVTTMSVAQSITTAAKAVLTAAAALTMAIIGSNVFVGMVIRDVATDSCARASGRVRRYFITRYPQVAPHVSWQKDDAPTRWVTKPQSINRRLVLILTMLFWGVAAAVGADRVVDNPGLSALAGLLVGVGSATVLWTWARARLRRAVRTGIADQRFHS